MNAVIFRMSQEDYDEINEDVEVCLTKMGRIMKKIVQLKSNEMGERRGRMGYRDDMDMEFRYPEQKRDREYEDNYREMDDRRGGYRSRSYSN